MAENNKLSSFMQKKFNEKSSKLSNNSKNSANSYKNKQLKQDKNDKNEENDDEKKKALEEAKKVSKGKAAQYNQAEVFKKMVIDSAVKVVIVFTVSAIVGIGLIEVVPSFLRLIGGTISNVFSLNNLR